MCERASQRSTFDLIQPFHNLIAISGPACHYSTTGPAIEDTRSPRDIRIISRSTSRMPPPRPFLWLPATPGTTYPPALSSPRHSPYCPASASLSPRHARPHDPPATSPWVRADTPTVTSFVTLRSPGRPHEQPKAHFRGRPGLQGCSSLVDSAMFSLILVPLPTHTPAGVGGRHLR